MKTMFLAAAAVLCLGTTAAYADGADTEGGAVANTWFSELPGVISTAPGAPANNVAANGYQASPQQATATPVTPPAARATSTN